MSKELNLTTEFVEPSAEKNVDVRSWARLFFPDFYAAVDDIEAAECAARKALGDLTQTDEQSAKAKRIADLKAELALLECSA
jgi:hypothetical protein